jgi:two-component system OmpR family response regulator
MPAQDVQPARRILVVDDDLELRQHIAAFLQSHGYVVHVAADARALERVLAETSVDLIVLDLMLPGEDGLSICRRLAGAGRPPIIMLSAMGEEVDRVLGLELGADDYLPKPCSPRELLARVRAVLRRADEGRAGSARAGGYQFLGFAADPRSRQVRAPNGVRILLTAGEFALLTAFLESPQSILSRDELLEHVRGGAPEAAGRAVDVQVSRLRRKLHAYSEDEIIRTCRGAGYMLDAKVTRI